MELLANIDSNIEDAQKVLADLRNVNTGTDQRIAWLERQLAHMVGQLQWLRLAVETGETTSGNGIWADFDTEEMLADSIAAIQNLKSLISIAREQGR